LGVVDSEDAWHGQGPFAEATLNALIVADPQALRNGTADLLAGSLPLSDVYDVAKLPSVADTAKSDAMHETLLAMLILSSCFQEQGDEGPTFEPPSVKRVIAIRTAFDDKVSEITIELAAPAVRANALTTAVVCRENFDRWVFDDMAPDKERWTHLDKLLSVRINDAARTHKLTDRQQAKLRLAGKGDIKRFFDQVEDARNDFELNRVGFKNGLAALRRLKPLSKVYDLGPFDDGSLFVKTLHKIDNDQAASN
jgi:hypothetical protein